MRRSVRCTLRWLHKVSVNTDCDSRHSQADLTFVSVALGEFTGVTLRYCNFSFLKKEFDSKQINCAFVSGPTCWQTYIYQSITHIAYRVLR
jgi:hypothetical protein